MKVVMAGDNETPLPTVNTTGYIDHAAFLGTINPYTNKITKHLFQGYLNIYNNYFNFFFQAEDGIRDKLVTGVQTCALPISRAGAAPPCHPTRPRGCRRRLRR